MFEFFLDDPVYERFAGRSFPEGTTWPHLDKLHERGMIEIDAFHNAGFDHATVRASAFDVMYYTFPDKGKAESVSMNEGNHIYDRESFASFPWCEPEDFDDSHLDTLSDYLPDNMKFLIGGPCGILEIVIQLMGYERLCYLLFDDPELLEEIFEAVGDRFLRYYRGALRHESVGAIIYNDDWGFNTGPMISPDDIKRLVFPWVQRIVAEAHKAAIPSIIHSCGNLYGPIMEGIIDELNFDAKHSYQDIILPVEDAYERLHERIAVLGGLDVDYLMSSSPEEIERRSRYLLERSAERGGYALGSGNSITKSIPKESFDAMRRAAGRL
ncbi:MAG: uroporphyrinogen decarboxylase family protein [Spirochaetaceae bacterium]